GLARLALPALAAVLLPLTGLSAGACQEAFHSWAEGYRASFGECLRAALARGPNHAAAQVLALAAPVAVLACATSPWLPGAVAGLAVLFLVPAGFALSLFGLARHPSFAAGPPRFRPPAPSR